MVAGRVEVAVGMFDVPEQMLSLRHGVLVAGARAERQSASEHDARAASSSPCA